MKIKAFAVLDTNVLVSAVISSSGYPYDILRLIQSGNVIPIYDERMLNEYKEVFHYDKLKISEETFQQTFTLILKSGLLIQDVETTKAQLLDQSDIPFFEVKESSEEFDSVLVTGNLKHYPEQRDIITPKEFILLLDQMERFIKIDFDYEKNVQQIIGDQIASGKYIEGYKVFGDESKDKFNSGRQSVLKMLDQYKQESQQHNVKERTDREIR